MGRGRSEVMTLLERPLAVVKLLIAGFHPSDEDLSLGTPDHPGDEDLSLGTPDFFPDFE